LVLLATALSACHLRHATIDTVGLSCLMSEHNMFARFGSGTPPPKYVQGTIGTCLSGARLLVDLRSSDEYTVGTATALVRIVVALRKYEAAVQSGDSDAAASWRVLADRSAQTLSELRARHGDPT
jgi:hypothetical protein